MAKKIKVGINGVTLPFILSTDLCYPELQPLGKATDSVCLQVLAESAALFSGLLWPAMTSRWWPSTTPSLQRTTSRRGLQCCLNLSVPYPFYVITVEALTEGQTAFTILAVFIPTSSDRCALPCSYMFKYDTTHGIYRGHVESAPGELIVDGHHIQSFSEKCAALSA